MNTAIKTTQRKPVDNLDSVLHTVLQEAKQEHHELQQMFELMGWTDLPDQLKIEIKDDVFAMVNELEGQYSSCDPYVQKRRQTVSYWISCFKDGICSLDTAIDALKVSKL